jgi:hypothetical protein
MPISATVVSPDWCLGLLIYVLSDNNEDTTIKRRKFSISHDTTALNKRVNF